MPQYNPKAFVDTESGTQLVQRLNSVFGALGAGGGNGSPGDNGGGGSAGGAGKYLNGASHVIWINAGDVRGPSS